MRLATTYDDYVWQESKDSNCEAYGSVLHECVTRLDEIDRIHKERWGWLPHMTILYDKRKDILILKLMVSMVHECVIHLDGINKICKNVGVQD
jgi:hypothetical protein